MSTYTPMPDQRDSARTLLLVLAAVLTILVCALTVLYASGTVDLNSTDSGSVTTTDPGYASSWAG